MNLHILLAGIFLLSAVPAGFAAEKAGIDDMFLEVENPGTWNPMNPKYRDAMSCVRSLTSMCKDSDSKMIDTPVSCFNERGELLEGIRNKLPPNIRLDGEKAVCEPQDTSRDTENSSEASTEKDAGPKEIERIIRRTPEYYTSNLGQTYGYQVVLANGTDSTYKKTRTESRGQTAEETTYDKGYNITRDFVQSHDFVVREGNFKGEQVYVVEGEYCLDPQILKYTKC